MSNLTLRLKNCLQTILELEPGMGEEDTELFSRDFLTIKSWLEQVDKMELEEEEVRRLEAVTSRVIAELSCYSPVSSARVLH